MYQDNRVSLRWQTPISSLFTEYHVKYRTFGKAGPGSWSAPIAVARTATTFTLTDLPPGEQFEIQVDSVSHHVPSGKPIGVTQIIGKKSLTYFSTFIQINFEPLQTHALSPRQLSPLYLTLRT